MIYLNVRKTSDKRPLTTSNASTLTYDTVPVDLCTIKEIRELVGGDAAEGNDYGMETKDEGQEEINTQQLEQSSTYHTKLGGGDNPWRKRIHGTSYENVLSPDVRQLHL